MVQESGHEADRYRDTVHGCLLGTALGDALGWPVELTPLSGIRANYGAHGIQEFDARASGGRGAITDDTQMMLFTAAGILRGTVRAMEKDGGDGRAGRGVSGAEREAGKSGCPSRRSRCQSFDG